MLSGCPPTISQTLSSRAAIAATFSTTVSSSPRSRPTALPISTSRAPASPCPSPASAPPSPTVLSMLSMSPPLPTTGLPAPSHVSRLTASSTPAGSIGPCFSTSTAWAMRLSSPRATLSHARGSSTEAFVAGAGGSTSRRSSTRIPTFASTMPSHEHARPSCRTSRAMVLSFLSSRSSSTLSSIVMSPAGSCPLAPCPGRPELLRARAAAA